MSFFGQIDAAARNIRGDLRFGSRSLRKTPVFTTVAIIALALGIGATTAILSVVNGVLLRPLPYADSDRLVVMLQNGNNPVAPASVIAWRQQMRSFTDIAAAEYWSANLTSGEQPENLRGLRVSSDVFPLLGVAPLYGRAFTAEEDVTGNEHVAVISYGLWQRRFGGDRSIVGRTISLDGEPTTVLGIMPPTFQFAPFWATHAEMWVPLGLSARAADRGTESLRTFARLKPGVTMEQARSDVASVTARLEREFPGTNKNVTVESLKHKVVGDIQTPLLVLLVAVGFVLLIACANVAHMLLSRASARQKELAIRTALGATRARLIAQLLAESVMLAIAGGVAGLLLALWGVRALIAANPVIIPRVSSVGIDTRVLLMTVLMTAATSIAFGLVPALRAARVDLAGTFKDGDRASTDGHRKHRLRSTLVMSEFALALVLLVGAGLMIRSFVALMHVDPGFDPRNIVTMTISTTGTPEANPAMRQAFFAQALDRVRAVPGIEAASYINHLPLTGDRWGFNFSIEGRPKPKPGESPNATYRVVFPGYFHAMRIPLLQGRDISDADRKDAPGVVVINEYMAKTYWPGEDPIGKRISTFGLPYVTIIGVVKNAAIDRWGAPPEEEFYFPFAQSSYATNPSSHFGDLTLVARSSCATGTRCDASTLSTPVVNAIRSVDRNVAISTVATMAGAVASATAESRFYLVLLGTFAAIALTLAAVGIYGVMSYSVSRRTHEMGIRIALGANPMGVVRLVVGEGVRLAGIGAVVGIAAALGLTRLMSKLLYGVAPSDPITFALVTLVLCGVGVFASYVPARRATKVDPLTALRSD